MGAKLNMNPSLMLNPEDEQWVESTLRQMSLEEKVGQIFIVGFWGITGNETAIARRIRDHHLGGFFHFAETQDALAAFVSDMQTRAKVPYFVACDYENGTGNYLKEGSLMPRPMSRGWSGSRNEEYEIGRRIAEQASAVGVNYSFSPVMDVNTNPMCPDVNIRAYSDVTEVVSEFGAGYIQGLQDHGVMATAKHFPGNGGTSMDQHICTAIIDHGREDYKRIFLSPFKAAIEAGVGSIMVAHLEVSALCRERHPVSGRVIPASMSKEIITDLLKHQMKFEGVVISDALDMGGVSAMYSREEANVKALQAGVDILLAFFPDSFERDIQSVLDAVNQGVISTERLDDAVRRVLRSKARLKLQKSSTSPASPETRKQVFEIGRNDSFSRDIAARSLTLLHNHKQVLPILSVEGKKVTVFNVFSPERKVMEGQGVYPLSDITAERLKARGANVETIEVVSDWTFREMMKIYTKTLDSDYVFLNFYVIPSFAIGTLTPNINAIRLFYRGILTEARNVVITAFGDPFVMMHYTHAPTCLFAFDHSENTQEVAVQAWFGEKAITGRMPVSLKGIFKRGDGIDLSPIK